MNRKHILVGEDFFRSMMRVEEERKRCFGGVIYGAVAVTTVVGLGRRMSCRLSGAGNNACRVRPVANRRSRRRNLEGRSLCLVVNMSAN
jgi:hypothetical protein